MTCITIKHFGHFCYLLTYLLTYLSFLYCTIKPTRIDFRVTEDGKNTSTKLSQHNNLGFKSNGTSSSFGHSKLIEW